MFLYVFVGMILAYVAYKYWSKDQEPSKEILEKDWKKDIVYLYQFPRSKTVPSVSPFCLKIESLLRLYNIKYENRFLLIGRSKYGLLPFIELNGQHIADSQLIEDKIIDHFNIKSGLTPTEDAIGRSVGRMMDNHLFYVIYKYKIYDDPKSFVSLFIADSDIPSFLHPIVLPILALIFKKKAGDRIFGALGKYKDHEFERLLNLDIHAVDTIKGHNKFIFGDKITPTDLTIFGLLGTIYYLPTNSLPKDLLKSKYNSLSVYLDNIRDELFPNDFTLQ